MVTAYANETSSSSPVVVDNQPVVEPYRDFLLGGIDLLDHADVTIENFLLVVVLRLDYLVPEPVPRRIVYSNGRSCFWSGTYPCPTLQQARLPPQSSST